VLKCRVINAEFRIVPYRTLDTEPSAKKQI